MRRLLSTAVEIKAPPIVTPTVDEIARVIPTEAEVRDGMAKVARELHDMVLARTAGEEGWSIGDMACATFVTSAGGVGVRGTVIIERSDGV